MKKKLNRKKLLINLVIIFIIIIGIISFFIVRHLRNNAQDVVPKIEIEEEQDDGMVKYENSINEIEIGDRLVETIENKQYIIIEIQNTSNEDIFKLPIGIEFVNKDGEVIYNTGYVVEVLLKGMSDQIRALITPEIGELIEKEKIDHIIIKELN